MFRELLKEDQITTNQLFEEFIVLAEQEVIDQTLSKEDAILELRSSRLLFIQKVQYASINVNMKTSGFIHAFRNSH